MTPTDDTARGSMGHPDEAPAKRRLLKRVTLVLLATVAVGYSITGPYVFPVAWGLGPCLKDWTSPSTYLPRSSPLMTTDAVSPTARVRVCYGAPSARGRVLFGDGGLVPYGAYWRTGANEPTRLFTDSPLRLGDLRVEPGRYSVYTLPGAEQWEVIVNGSTFQWGYDFSDGVVAQEVGRIRIPAQRTPAFEERFTIRFEDGAGGADSQSLTLAWGDVRLVVPVEVIR